MRFSRDSYTWRDKNGFRVGLYGNMEIVGGVRTYGIDGKAIVDAFAHIVDTTMSRGKVQVMQERRFNIALAPRFDDTLPPEQPNSKRTPVREMTIDGDVKVPFIQSAITGVLKGTLISIFTSTADGILSELYTHELLEVIRWYHHGLAGLVFAIAVTDNQWQKSVNFGRSLLYTLETWTDGDIDGDGFIGEPERIKPRSVRVTDSQGTRYENLSPVSADDGFTFAEWRAAAVAILVHNAAVSKRGIMAGVKESPYQLAYLGQGKAQEIANILHEQGRAVDNVLTRSGYEWLISYVPDHITITTPLPS